MCLSEPWAVTAQPAFTNSAAISAELGGPNLSIAYSTVNTQGWVTLLAADTLDGITVNPEFLAATNVPGSQEGQFVVPFDPGVPARFYRLLLEEWPSYLFNYPDLSVIIPPGQTYIFGTGTNRVFRYTHDTYNGGPGPLAIQPFYHPTSGNYLGYQEVYFYHSGTWTLVQTNPVAGAFVFESEHGHFHFPFARFGLYHENPDGSVGGPAALSEKIGFCIADSFIISNSLPNAGAFGNWGSCSDPTSKRGLSIGAVDEYNYLDPGQDINIADLPDGRYWLRTIADPDNLFLESDESNNETYLKVAITNNTVTELETMQPTLTPPPTVFLTAPGPGVVAGTVELEASTPVPGVSGVQFLVDGLAFGEVVTNPPYTLSWDTTVLPNGAHWLAAQATDAADRTGTSDTTFVQVNNVNTNPPVVDVTDPDPGSTVSAVTTVSANAAAEVGIPTVQFYVDEVELGGPLTNPPFMTSWNTLTFSNGLHQLTATATGVGGLASTSAVVSVTVDNSSPPELIGVDTMAVVDSSDTMQTPSFSTTSATNLLVAFVAYDGPDLTPQTVTVSGAGLLWQLAIRSNTQNGVSEIWVASATNQLSSVTVTSQPGITGYHGSLTVIAFTNASGAGIVAQASAPTGAPEIYVPAAKAGSWIFAVGNDWDGAIARTPVAGQVIVHERVDTQVGDTFWVQSTLAPLVGDGLVTISDTHPTNHQWNYAAIEIVATRQ